jgi:hypothetical protein
MPSQRPIVRAARLDPCIMLAVFSAALVFDAMSSAMAQGALHRMWDDLIARPSGPLAFRFLLQPVMAAIIGVRDGLKDAQTGRSPYFWTVLSQPDKRNARLREGAWATSRIILLGLVMDAIYQFKVFGTFYPVEALIIVLVLAFIPYLLIRGPVARIARWRNRRMSSNHAQGAP